MSVANTMKPLTLRPTLVERAYEALIDGICDGTVPVNTHLVQEQLAERLGVSRQPIQQAMLLLKNDGVLEETGRRGLIVPPLDPASVRQRYQIRAALDVLAARLATRRCAAEPGLAAAVAREGEALLAAGDAAVRGPSVAQMIARDMAFHAFLYRVSGNPFIGPTADLHWPILRRLMGEVHRRCAQPPAVWEHHSAILEAVLRGDEAASAERAAEHVEWAARRLTAKLADPDEACAAQKQLTVLVG